MDDAELSRWVAGMTAVERDRLERERASAAGAADAGPSSTAWFDTPFPAVPDQLPAHCVGADAAKRAHLEALLRSPGSALVRSPSELAGRTRVAWSGPMGLAARGAWAVPGLKSAETPGRFRPRMLLVRCGAPHRTSGALKGPAACAFLLPALESCGARSDPPRLSSSRTHSSPTTPSSTVRTRLKRHVPRPAAQTGAAPGSEQALEPGGPGDGPTSFCCGARKNAPAQPVPLSPPTPLLPPSEPHVRALHRVQRAGRAGQELVRAPAACGAAPSRPKSAASRPATRAHPPPFPAASSSSEAPTPQRDTRWWMRRPACA